MKLDIRPMKANIENDVYLCIESVILFSYAILY